MRYMTCLNIVILSLAVAGFSFRVKRVDIIECEDSQSCVLSQFCHDFNTTWQLSLEQRRKRLKPCGYNVQDALICCNYPANIEPQSKVPSGDKGQCGVMQLDRDLRIAGGEPSSPGRWPWMARLLYSLNENEDESDKLSTQCGGALVSARHVVTAAHCLRDTAIGEPVSVVLGESDIRYQYDRVDGDGGLDGEEGRICQQEGRCADKVMEIKVRKVVTHPEFSLSGVDGVVKTFRTRFPVSDIGLVLLERSVTFSSFVQPVCLPDPERKLPADAPTQPIFVTGWGNTEKGIGVAKNALVLQELELEESPLGDRNTGCRGVTGRDLLDTNICVSTGTTDAVCQGDSGGPLVRLVRSTVVDTGFWELIGVVSFGTSVCGQQGVPLVGTRLEHPGLLNWIQEQMEIAV